MAAQPLCRSIGSVGPIGVKVRTHGGSFGFSSGLLGYLLLINLVTLGAMALDKAAARAHGSRISEFTVFFLSLIGGVWGTIAGMFIFRHKTHKPEFQVVIFLIVLLNLALPYCLFA